MRIKSFIAPTVQEALATVKREMGDSSIILETRNIEEGDIKSEPGQKLVEVVAAELNIARKTDQHKVQGIDQDPEQNTDQDVKSNEETDDSSIIPEIGNIEEGDMTSESEHKLVEVIAAENNFSQSTDLDKAQGIDQNTDQDVQDNNTLIDLPGQALQHFSQLEQELTEQYLHVPVPDLAESVREDQSDSQMSNNILTDHTLLKGRNEMVEYSTNEESESLLRHQDCNLSDNWPGKSKKLYKQLRAQQVEKGHARILINEMLCKMSSDESETLGLQRLMIQKSIINKIKISTSNLNDHEACKAIAFIGASGTGKTTTILKLASELKKRSDKNILLISIQGHSAEKLSRHARLIGATLRTATSPRELGGFRDEFGETSHILIDTPGICHLDNNTILNLKKYTDEIPDLETHLVISATTRYIDIISLVNKLTASSIHRLLFTRVDETDLHGTLFSVAMETKIPLSYVTDGEEIPEDIRPVTSEMVSEMVMRT